MTRPPPISPLFPSPPLSRPRSPPAATGHDDGASFRERMLRPGIPPLAHLGREQPHRLAHVLGERRVALHEFGRELLVQAQHVDRKSTRLNSSHSQISYAVFC